MVSGEKGRERGREKGREQGNEGQGNGFGLVANHGTIVPQVVVILGKLGGENFANDFSGLGFCLPEAALDIGTGNRDSGRVDAHSGVQSFTSDPRAKLRNPLIGRARSDAETSKW
jgi:hypothetical protein